MGLHAVPSLASSPEKAAKALQRRQNKERLQELIADVEALATSEVIGLLAEDSAEERRKIKGDASATFVLLQRMSTYLELRGNVDTSPANNADLIAAAEAKVESIRQRLRLASG